LPVPTPPPPVEPVLAVAPVPAPVVPGPLLPVPPTPPLPLVLPVPGAPVPAVPFEPVPVPAEAGPVPPFPAEFAPLDASPVVPEPARPSGPPRGPQLRPGSPSHGATPGSARPVGRACAPPGNQTTHVRTTLETVRHRLIRPWLAALIVHPNSVNRSDLVLPAGCFAPCARFTRKGNKRDGCDNGHARTNVLCALPHDINQNED
jgi:hypothetical protein